MGTLYLVRHGQASFGAADYDQLSDLGSRQCERLGAWFAGHGVRFDAVLLGTLRRQAQSLAAIEAGLGRTHDSEQVQVRPALDEYDMDAVLRALDPSPITRADTPEQVRAFFRRLREALLAWMAGRTQPEGLPTHAQFHAAIVQVLDAVRAQHAGGTVLAVSSGGPIAHAVGHVLGLGHEAIVELNLHLRNSSVCELRVTPRRLSLVTFNSLTHLDAAECRDWVTHA